MSPNPPSGIVTFLFTFRPERVYQLNAPDLPSDFPPLHTLDAKRTNLPAQSTPLIRREREVAALLNLLRRDDVRFKRDTSVMIAARLWAVY